MKLSKFNIFLNSCFVFVIQARENPSLWLPWALISPSFASQAMSQPLFLTLRLAKVMVKLWLQYDALSEDTQ